MTTARGNGAHRITASASPRSNATWRWVTLTTTAGGRTWHQPSP
jgi:hypothetical protein